MIGLKTIRPLAMVAAFALGTGTATAETRFLTLSGGGDTGSWYAGSAIIADIVNSTLAETILTPEPGGGVANMAALQEGRSQFAFMFTSTTAQAYNGGGNFTPPHDRLRGVMALAPMYAHLVVRDDSEIRSFSDLNGRVVSPGLRAFSGAQTFLGLLAAHGMSVESIEAAGGSVQWLDYADGTQNMRDGLVDALFSTSAIPHSSYNELAASFPIRIVPIGDDIRASFGQSYPGWGPAMIPAGVYGGVDEPVATIADTMGLATSADVSDDVVYEFTKTVWENRQRLIEGYPAYRNLDAETALSSGFLDGVPLHPGARRYWVEIGLLSE